MDGAWPALWLSLQVATWATLACLVLGTGVGYALARWRFPGRDLVDTLLTLPMVMPPTVLGYYLLVLVGGQSVLGQWAEQVLGVQLAFSFWGLLLASVVFNVPFMVQPMQRAFESIPRPLIEACQVSGLSAWQTFWRVELPLAWPGVVSACVLTFVHTLGEFGVVLMVGGSIPGETRTIAISIYDKVQGFDLASANQMALLLLVLSLLAVAASFLASARLGGKR